MEDIDVSTRHKKELKFLEGETRAAIKKAKGVKGKKGKELLTSTEAEYAQKLADLLETHKQELLATVSGIPCADVETTIAITATPSEPEQTEPSSASENKETSEKDRKIDKAKRKKEKQKEKERLYQQELAELDANAGPSMRKMELELLEAQLMPLSLKISEIQSDGNCLYRAVAAQCGMTYIQVRALCAEQLAAHPEDYEPFCELTDSITSFDQYVQSVKLSSDWGGHLELRALSEGLKRCIVVYSANQPMLVLGDDTGGNVIRLSYHLHYYSLGEHYNQVVQNSACRED